MNPILNDLLFIFIKKIASIEKLTCCNERQWWTNFVMSCLSSDVTSFTTKVSVLLILIIFVVSHLIWYNKVTGILPLNEMKAHKLLLQLTAFLFWFCSMVNNFIDFIPSSLAFIFIAVVMNTTFFISGENCKNIFDGGKSF